VLLITHQLYGMERLDEIMVPGGGPGRPRPPARHPRSLPMALDGVTGGDGQSRLLAAGEG